MIIQIDDNQRISSNEYSWDIEILHTPKKAGSDPYWKKIKYYPTFISALSEACEREIRKHPASNLSDAIEAVTALREKYQSILDAGLEFIQEN